MLLLLAVKSIARVVEQDCSRIEAAKWPVITDIGRCGRCAGKLVTASDQAAAISWGASMPSVNLMPSMTFGNWF